MLPLSRQELSPESLFIPQKQSDEIKKFVISSMEHLTTVVSSTVEQGDSKQIRRAILLARDELLRSVYRQLDGSHSTAKYSESVDVIILQICQQQLTNSEISQIADLRDEFVNAIKDASESLLFRTDALTANTCDLILLSQSDSIAVGSETITPNELFKTLLKLRMKGYVPSLEIYHKLMTAMLSPKLSFSFDQNLRAYFGENVIDMAATTGISLTPTTFALLFALCAPRYGWELQCSKHIIRLESKMLKRFKMQHTHETLFSIITALLAGGKPEFAFNRFNEMSIEEIPRTIELYNAIIWHCSKRPSTSRYVLHELRYTLYREENVVPNEETYRNMMYCCARSGDLVSANQLETEMKENGIEDEVSTKILNYLRNNYRAPPERNIQ